MSEDDERLVESADRRARIVAWLRANPGEHGRTEVCEAITGDTHGLNNFGAMLKEMSEQGLINRRAEGGHTFYSYREPPERQRRVKPVGAGELPPDVELVIDGSLTIVVGRNPDNGRIRVTFFDMKE